MSVRGPESSDESGRGEAARLRRSAVLAAFPLLIILFVSPCAFAVTSAPSIAGTWQSMTPNNNYLLQITWNQAAGRFEGVLVRQGFGSQGVGFSLGELCWTATPTANPTRMQLLEEWRWGTNGVSRRAQWRAGVVMLDRSTPFELVTSSTVFRRVGASPVQAPPRYSFAPAAPTAPEMQAPARRAVSSENQPPPPESAPEPQSDVVAPTHWIGDLPAVETVLKMIPDGKDAQETAARQAAAFLVLEDLISAFTDKSVGELSKMPRLAESRFREYDAASNRIYRGAKAPVWALSSSRAFSEDVVARTMPSAKELYWTTRTARFTSMRQRVAANAVLNTVKPAPPPAAPSAPIPSRPTPEPTAAMLNDVKRAKAAGGSLDAFDVQIGHGLTIPACFVPKDGLEGALRMLTGVAGVAVATTCDAGASLWDATTAQAALMQTESLAATAFKVKSSKRPDWLHPTILPVALQQHGVVVGVFATTNGADAAALNDLRHQYGPEDKPKRKGNNQGRKDWSLAGLHVVLGGGVLMIGLESWSREQQKVVGDRWPLPQGASARPARGGQAGGRVSEDDGEDERIRRAHKLDKLDQDETERVNTQNATGQENTYEKERIEQERQDPGQ